MYKRILVATDGSDLSARAVTHAISLAKLCGAQLFVLKVVSRYPQTYFEGGIALDADEVKRVEQSWEDEGRTIILSVEKEASIQGVKVNGYVEKSDIVSEAVLDLSKKCECDLIIMASHGRKGISRLLLGSETQHVLTHANIPVLVLR